jgi:methyl-accepting chemotaxis protein
VIDKQLADGSHFSNSMILGAGVIGLLLLLISLVVARSASVPLRSLARGMRRLASGEFDTALPELRRRDEIGEIARAVAAFKAKAVQNAEHEAERKAEQDRQKAEQGQRSAAEREAAIAVVKEIVQAAAAGDFSKRVALEGKTGIVLDVGTSINTLCGNVAKALNDLIHMLGALAAGDLTKRIAADYQGDFATLKDDANRTADRLTETLSDIKSVGREVSNAAAEISASTTDLSQRTKEQAASLEQTSASMAEMSATVKKNAENALQANRLTSGSRAVADKGGQVVTKAVDAMAASQEQATSIDQINKALSQMDEVTQHNSALVQENAASSRTLEHQLEAMNERAAFFKLDERAPPQAGRTPPVRLAAGSAGSDVAPVRKTVTATVNGKRGPIGRMQAAVATALAEDKSWAEF